MGAAALLIPVGAGARTGSVAGAIIGHAGRGGGDRGRWNNCDRRRLDYDLRRCGWNIGRGASARLFGGFVGGSATTEDEKGSGKT